MSEAQITEIAGNVNHGYISGRDLYLGDQYVVQETLFFEPDLTDVEPPAWATTPKARELAAAFKKDRLIILAGQDLDDKTMIARHLAWLLRQELPGEVQVREWYRSSDPQKIETAFHETATTILLLPQILPHHIGHRLNDLLRLLQARRNYTVITTDGTRADWGIRSGSPEESFWRELSSETYYGRAFLAETFLAGLRELNGRAPGWLPRDLESGSILAEKLTVEEISARLKQPDRIRRFVEWLQTEEASPANLPAQLEQLGGDRSAIFEWYRQLERTDQLFALALALFDGLPDDQVFAAVEYLVDEAWRRTDPNLPLFDYRDLARLGVYFRLAAAGEDGERIETLSQQKRQAILEAAWELQRRRILSVVPAMTRLIRQLSPGGAKPEGSTEAQEEDSPSWKRLRDQVGPEQEKPAKPRRRLRKKEKKAEEPQDADSWRFTQGPERELFSSQRRIEQLQRSVIESLSQIGLLSFEAVEASVLELAVEGSVGVQTVVAKALAAWRGQGHHEKLFSVLRNWWEAGSRTTLPKILAQRKVEGADPLAAIRATVALAAGYAFQYDPPNQLAPELHGLLQVVLVDTHPGVRQRVLELTLPLAAASHPQQLEALLRERLSRDQEQMNAIAFGLAMAFALYPFTALQIIERWYLIAQSMEPRRDRAITARELLLAAVALSYGYIRCEPDQDFLTPDHIVAALRSILTAESHLFVRRNALIATGLQGMHDFEAVAPMLMELISQVSLLDRMSVVSVFTRAYLKQRERLTGGDGEIEVAGRSYQVWRRTPRPLTAIEESLYTWLRDRKHPVARQIAAQTFAALAATDLERQESDLGIRQERIAAPAPGIGLQRAANPRKLHWLPPLGYVAAFVAAPLRGRIRSLLRPVLAELIQLERSRKSAAPREPQAQSAAVLDRWRTSDDREVQGLARSTRTAFHLFRWRWVIILTAVLSSVLYLDWREWAWSRGTPLLLSETVALQQRRAVPLRFARNEWRAVFRRRAEEQQKEKEKKRQEEERRRPPKKAPGEPKPEPRKTPNGPQERQLWSAKLALERLDGPGWMRGVLKPKGESQKLPAEVQPLARFAKPKVEPRPAAGELAPAPSDLPVFLEKNHDSAAPPDEAVTSPPVPAQLESLHPSRENTRLVPEQLPAPEPASWLERFRRPRQKKQPPSGGENHGNR